jgi:hypothetical protein
MCLEKMGIVFTYACIYGVVGLSATFDNSSVVSWMSGNWWRRPEYPEKSTDQPKVTVKLYIHICICVCVYVCTMPNDGPSSCYLTNRNDVYMSNQTV